LRNNADGVNIGANNLEQFGGLENDDGNATTFFCLVCGYQLRDPDSLVSANLIVACMGKNRDEVVRIDGREIRVAQLCGNFVLQAFDHPV